MAQKDPSKTEKATKKRLDKARNKGSVAKSQELPKIIVLFTGVVLLYFLIGNLSHELKDIYIWSFKNGFTTTITSGGVYEIMFMLSKKLAVMLLPIMFVLCVVAFITQRLQVGKIWYSRLFNPDFSHIFNPLGGLQRLLISPQTLFNLGKQVAQAAAIAVAPYLVLKKEFSNFLPLFYQTPHGLAAYILGTGMTMVLYALVPMAIIALVDVWYSRWTYAENMKMSKDEIKDERRQSEGDPRVKQQQRKKMFEVMKQRMMADVPKADVVITNPTHIACALRYDPVLSPAPILVAKGLDHLAEKIKEIAREHKIPIRENKPLAQALYKSVEIGQTIPLELYQAVATMLAQLDKFRGKRR
ncbi:flagellar biosynthesis protein FlhB [Desulfolutivibrio sulfoxidireducens]|uniref:flagellar biosynthesis protein FlhB n=1 Tax=Desulfolutivibrio sulfoxidireducens TaxID=2773299 RepID=UPI00159EA25E|nr:flagellar biosynthesis protein FlhB [Desulfolutivibrio sulfoxidireducens]QLA16410.1 flagellar biosynthesis protein FlhB [Desulfolutivibrio sulfoxidireducens]QLA19709.1 flagellar biosynthesis protein FlhB [Desulfolutivibrio sulfoxidireducens]